VRVADLPEGLHNRTREIWRPLLAIADVAGGHWPARAREAAATLHTSHTDELDYRLRLLADIRAVYDTLRTDRMHTADLIRELAKVEESPWRGWWWDDYGAAPKADAASALAKNLRGYGVRPEQVRIGTTSKKGYKREQFEDVWNRYLPAHIAETRKTPETSGSHAETSVSMFPLFREHGGSCSCWASPGTAARSKRSYDCCGIDTTRMTTAARQAYTRHVTELGTEHAGAMTDGEIRNYVELLRGGMALHRPLKSGVSVGAAMPIQLRRRLIRGGGVRGR